MFRLKLLLGLIIILGIAGFVFFADFLEKEVIEIKYTEQKLTYTVLPVRETQVDKLIFWEATEVQYLITNTDTTDGIFTLNFIFDNGDDMESTTQKVEIAAGAQEAVTKVSPLSGRSNVTLNVVPSTKQVPHEIIVTKPTTIWDKIQEMSK